jgi:hypothetical protein
LSFNLSGCNADSNDSDSKKIKEGEIVYEIKYPTYKRKNSILFKILPKQMITTFKDNCYKNEFIFSNNALALTIISDCNKKQTTLSYCDGARKKFTNIDSANINLLLDQLPKYSKSSDKIETSTFLNLPSNMFELICEENQTVFDVTSSKSVQINKVNWCTPFHEIDDVLLNYQMTQFGIDMEFNAVEINEKSINSSDLIIDSSYKIESMEKYLDEIKMFFSIF